MVPSMPSGIGVLASLLVHNSFCEILRIFGWEFPLQVVWHWATQLAPWLTPCTSTYFRLPWYGWQVVRMSFVTFVMKIEISDFGGVGSSSLESLLELENEVQRLVKLSLHACTIEKKNTISDIFTINLLGFIYKLHTPWYFLWSVAYIQTTDMIRLPYRLAPLHVLFYLFMSFFAILIRPLQIFYVLLWILTYKIRFTSFMYITLVCHHIRHVQRSLDLEGCRSSILPSCYALFAIYHYHLWKKREITCTQKFACEVEMLNFSTLAKKGKKALMFAQTNMTHERECTVVKHVVCNQSTHQMNRNSRDTHTKIDILDGERIIILILIMMISHVYYLLGTHSLFLSKSSPNTTCIYILVESSYFGMSPSLVPLLKYEGWEFWFL
jgi:hypothetical protein